MAKQTKLSTMPGWIFRVFLLSFGGILVAMGWEAQSHGYLWAQSFSERYGRPVVSPTLAWILLGGLLILAGLFRGIGFSSAPIESNPELKRMPHPAIFRVRA